MWWGLIQWSSGLTEARTISVLDQFTLQYLLVSSWYGNMMTRDNIQKYPVNPGSTSSPGVWDTSGEVSARLLYQQMVSVLF